MRFLRDQRGQSVVIGTVILFGFLILALSLYQAQIVPAENSEVEFEHSQDVEEQFLTLRNTIGDVATTGSARSTAIPLGTRYPQRTFAINPPPATGRLETTPARPVEINATVAARAHPNVQAFWADVAPTFNTQSIQYTPQYNELRSAGHLTYEHSYVTTEVEDAVVLRSEQTLVRDDRLSVPLLTGNLSETGVQPSAIDIEPRSHQQRTIPITGNGSAIELRLPTAVDNATALATRLSIPAAETITADGDTIVITFPETETYRLGLGAVAVAAEPEPAPAYLVPVGGEDVLVNQSVGVEVRDKYNNPVPGATVTIDGENRTTNDAGRVFTTPTATGELVAQLNSTPASYEEVVFDVRAAGSDGATGTDSVVGPNITVVPSDRNVTVQAGATLELGDRGGGGTVTLAGEIDSVGTVDRARSGTPIQAIQYDVVGPDGAAFITDARYAQLDTDLSDRQFTFDGANASGEITNETLIDTSEWPTGTNTLRLRAQDATGRLTSASERANVTVTVEDPPNSQGTLTNAMISDVGTNVGSDDNEVQNIEFELQGSGLADGETVTINLNEAQAGRGGGASGTVEYRSTSVNVVSGTGNANINTNRGQGEATLTYTSGGDSTGEIIIEIRGYATDGEAGPYSVSFTRDDTNDGDTDTFSVVPTAPTFVGEGRYLETIQAGVNNAGVNGDVRVDSGVYPESVTVGDAGISIQGSAGTLVEPPGGEPGYSINADRISITGMNITGAGDGVVSDDARSNLTVRNTIITDSTRGVALSDIATDITINEVTVEDTSETGIYFNDLADGVSLTNLELTNIGQDGESGVVFNGRATDSVIRNAVITNPGTDGITFNGETDTTTIEQTTVSEAGTAGVRFSGTADTVLFDQLTVDRAANDGMYFNDVTTNLTFTSSTFSDNGQFGLQFNDQCDVSGSGNTFTNNADGTVDPSGCNPNTN